MDGREWLDVTPDMIALTDGKLVLRVRNLGPLGERWTLGTCLTCSSALLEQHAGLWVGTPETGLRLPVGRPGQPYDLRLLGPAGEKLTAAPTS